MAMPVLIGLSGPEQNYSETVQNWSLKWLKGHFETLNGSIDK